MVKIMKKCELYVNNEAYSCTYKGTSDSSPLDVKGNIQGTVTGVGMVILSEDFPKVRANQIYTKYDNPIKNSEDIVRKYIPQVNYRDIF